MSAATVQAHGPPLTDWSVDSRRPSVRCCVGSAAERWRPRMDYQFTAIPNRTHLHTIGSGTHSPENLRRFLSDTHRVVLEQRWDAVLLEMQFSGPSLDLGNLYSIIVERSTDAAILRRIAYVDRNTEHLPERAEFAELA